MTADAQISPTRSDPDLRAGSEFLGGPAGDHESPPGFWTPLRVILVVGTVVYWLGFLRTYPCMSNGWLDPDRYEAVCYSDVPVLYQLRGIIDGYLPIVDWPVGGQPLEYPALTAVLVWATAKLTAVVGATPLNYYITTALVSFVLYLVALTATALTVRGRTWDGMLYAIAPAVFLASFINWDWLAVAFTALALLAWSRQRPAWAGVALGLAISAKFYPLLLLGPLLLLCLRAKKLKSFAVMLGTTASVWLLVNVPLMAANFEGWSYFFRFSNDRDVDFGSVWLLLRTAGHPVPDQFVNAAATAALLLMLAGIAALILFPAKKPRLAQVAFLTVAAFIVTNKVYSPQFVLWLLPLAVLARPRWRDLIWWQLAEAVYFFAIWWHLVGLAGGKYGLSDQWYAAAIAVHVIATLALAAVIVRDIIAPQHDPVRTDGDPAHEDDPGGGVLDMAAVDASPAEPVGVRGPRL